MSATTDFIYEYKLENGTVLNLSNVEEDVYVDIYVPIKNLEVVKFDLTKQFAEQGYDIYDKNSEFYTDFCTPASFGDNDVTLADRQKDIYPHNVTLCKSNCKYNGINIEEQRVICSCNLNSDKNIEDEEFQNEDGNFLTYLLDNINYKIFKCYKLFFNFNNLRKSYPFYIILIIFTIIQIINFIFNCYTINKLKVFMEKEIPMNKKVFNNKKEESKRLSILKEGNPPIKKNKRKSKNKIQKNGKKNPNIFICVLNDKMPNTKRSIIKYSKNELLKNSNKSIITQDKYEPISIKEENINEFPYSKAVRLDKRNVFLIFYSFIIQKLELIDIFCGGSKIKIILLGEYILSLLINFFFNSLLYTDDVVSNKYHNNGELDLIVTLTLSIISNIVTSAFCYYIKYSRGIEERISLIAEIRYKRKLSTNIEKFISFLRLKYICFFIVQLLVFAACLYYIVIFCILYNRSQKSLIVNYCYSLVESIITAFGIALIVLVFRKIGLGCGNKNIYNTSLYINSKF